MVDNTPLCVDLDGTLILTDMLHESAFSVSKSDLSSLISLPFWLFKGKAILKHKLARKYSFDPSLLPYNQPFLDWLKDEKSRGRSLVLCTASDRRIAEVIANYLSLFDDVIASDGEDNLSSEMKAKALVGRFGEGGFDYAGNSMADVKVWEICRRAIVVNASTKVKSHAVHSAEVECFFDRDVVGVTIFLKAVRLHQWLKNLLLFVPVLAAHKFGNFDVLITISLAFLSFSLCASSVYIFNDLMDLESDRNHPRKCKRPFASGALQIWKGVILAPILLLVSFILSIHIQGSFFQWLTLYFSVTCFYSFWLKRLILIDCITLAILYTLRVVAGAAALELNLSFWLLAFSIFLFLTLSFVKRYAELQLQIVRGNEEIMGRGYYTTDAPLIQIMGIASSYSSILVLALYLNSNAVSLLYSRPEWMWGCIPVLLFWNSWMWLQAHRGQMHDDPLVFAVRDPISLFSGVSFAVFLVAATLL